MKPRIVMQLIFCLLIINVCNAQKDSATIRIELVRQIDSLYSGWTHFRYGQESREVYEASFEKSNHLYSATYFKHRGTWEIFDNLIPFRAVRVFDSIFADANDVEWDLDRVKGTEYEVSFECRCSENYTSVIIDTNGMVHGKDRLLSLSEVPEKMSNYLKEHYPNYSGGWIDEKFDRNNVATYNLNTLEIGCSDCPSNLVTFDAQGNFIKEKYSKGW